MLWANANGDFEAQKLEDYNRKPNNLEKFWRFPKVKDIQDAGAGGFCVYKGAGDSPECVFLLFRREHRQRPQARNESFSKMISKGAQRFPRMCAGVISGRASSNAA